MAARECAEMRKAVKLVKSGKTITESAIKAGVSRRGLQNALKREKAKESRDVRTGTESSES